MKKFMKGLLATTMVFAMMTSLVGCGGGSEAEAPAEEKVLDEARPARRFAFDDDADFESEIKIPDFLTRKKF